MRALVSGFDAFGGERINASLAAVQRLPARIGDVAITTLELPTSFARAPAALEAALARIKPDLVLCVGEAGERNVLSIERVALNLDDARIADNDGARPLDTPVIASAPTAYFATLPVKRIATALSEAKIPTEISNSAGTFVCNHVFYRLMHYAAISRQRWRGGFLHVPHATMPLDDIARGIGIVLETAAAHAG